MSLVTTMPKKGEGSKVYDVPDAELAKYEPLEAKQTSYEEGKDRIAEGEERARLWASADDVNQGQYAIYQSRTKRPIPVVVLEPR